MSRQARATKSVAVGRRRAAAALATIGGRVAAARKVRGWSQLELARRLGITQARVSQIEAGEGDGVPAHVWFATADALAMPLRFEFGRDPLQELEDAGHLELQEFMLELGRQTGRRRSFELTIKASPGYSVDVGLRDDTQRLLILEECWNTFGNLGASVRSTRRKVAEMEELAVAIGGEHGPYKVAACWVIRDAPRNRAVVERYRQIFDATFTGSQAEWVRALTKPGARPPSGLGVIWCDPRTRRLRPVNPLRRG
jgi:transcriptional regulator with XRE-family HTH domain